MLWRTDLACNFVGTIRYFKHRFTCVCELISIDVLFNRDNQAVERLTVAMDATNKAWKNVECHQYPQGCRLTLSTCAAGIWSWWIRPEMR